MFGTGGHIVVVRYIHILENESPAFCSRHHMLVSIEDACASAKHRFFLA